MICGLPGDELALLAPEHRIPNLWYSFFLTCYAAVNNFPVIKWHYILETAGTVIDLVAKGEAATADYPVM